jgi:hypothetical protein
MTPKQYARIAASVYARSPCSLLVFGCGADSLLWHELNQGGKTIFLEDAPPWADKSRTAGLQVLDVRYESKLNVWLDNVKFPAGFSAENMQAAWDIVLVDAPLGVGPGPGREQSIYTSGCIRQQHGSLIYVHDYGRRWEKACCNKYLATPTSMLGDLAIWEQLEAK